MDNQLHQAAKHDLAITSYTVFFRCLSLVALLFGMLYWIRLVGVFSGTLWRIDRMPWQWQLLTATLSVLYPIAALGLWMQSLWGVILWFCAALAETLAFTVYSANFIYLPSTAAFHFMVALVFIVFQIILFLKKKKKYSYRILTSSVHRQLTAKFLFLRDMIKTQKR